MGDMQLAEQSFPTTPSSGNALYFADNLNSVPYVKNDAGLYVGQDTIARTTQIASHSADTYYLGYTLPSWGVQAGMSFRWTFPVTKTAGTAGPVYQVRIGAAGTTADTSRLSITGTAQTAVADTGKVEVLVTVRSVGASGVLQGHAHMQHNLAATGLANTPAGFNLVQATSAGFDNQASAIGGLIIGLSVNPGASGAWVVEQVILEVMV